MPAKRHRASPKRGKRTNGRDIGANAKGREKPVRTRLPKLNSNVFDRDTARGRRYVYRYGRTFPLSRPELAELTRITGTIARRRRRGQVLFFRVQIETRGRLYKSSFG